jgi:hypothetical protein
MTLTVSFGSHGAEAIKLDVHADYHDPVCHFGVDLKLDGLVTSIYSDVDDE